MFGSFGIQNQQAGFGGGMSPFGGMSAMGLGGMSPLGMMGMQGGPMQQVMMMLQGLMMMMLIQQLMQAMSGQGQGQGGFPMTNPGFGGGGGCCGGVSPAGRMGRGVGNFLGRHNPAPAGGTASAGGAAPPAGPTGSARADYAAKWAGKAFKPGQTKRCADFVSTMLRQSGTAPPGFRHTALAADFAKYGSQVGRGQLQAGDVVLFGNTYRPGKYTHVGVYLGNGKFVHRPTANKPVRVDSLSSGYYANKFTEGRRM